MLQSKNPLVSCFETMDEEDVDKVAPTEEYEFVEISGHDLEKESAPLIALHPMEETNLDVAECLSHSSIAEQGTFDNADDFEQVLVEESVNIIREMQKSVSESVGDFLRRIELIEVAMEGVEKAVSESSGYKRKFEEKSKRCLELVCSSFRLYVFVNFDAVEQERELELLQSKLLSQSSAGDNLSDSEEWQLIEPAPGNDSGKENICEFSSDEAVSGRYDASTQIPLRSNQTLVILLGVMIILFISSVLPSVNTRKPQSAAFSFSFFGPASRQPPALNEIIVRSSSDSVKTPKLSFENIPKSSAKTCLGHLSASSELVHKQQGLGLTQLNLSVTTSNMLASGSVLSAGLYLTPAVASVSSNTADESFKSKVVAEATTIETFKSGAPSFSWSSPPNIASIPSVVEQVEPQLSKPRAKYTARHPLQRESPMMMGVYIAPEMAVKAGEVDTGSQPTIEVEEEAYEETTATKGSSFTATSSAESSMITKETNALVAASAGKELAESKARRGGRRPLLQRTALAAATAVTLGIPAGAAVFYLSGHAVSKAERAKKEDRDTSPASIAMPGI